MLADVRCKTPGVLLLRFLSTIVKILEKREESSFRFLQQRQSHCNTEKNDLQNLLIFQ